MESNDWLANFIISHEWAIAIYIVLITLAIIVMVTIRIKTRKRYMVVKKEILNLGIWKLELAPSDNEFLQQLWGENLRLIEENKTLKKESSKLGFRLFIFLIIFLIYSYIKKYVSFKKSA